MAKTFSRRISLAKWIAEESVTVLRLGDGAESDRDRRGVGERHDDVVRLDLPGVGDDLREDRFHALALRAGAGGDIDLAGRIDAHGGALERADAGALDVAAEAETEIATLRARLVLPRPERRDAADAVERLLQGLWIVAAVVDDGLAVAIGNAETIRHLLVRDHVAQPHIGRIESEFAGDEVHCPLHRERGLRPSGAAIGSVRHLAGRDDARMDGEIVELVRPGQMHRGVVGDAGADRIPGAAVGNEAVAECEQPAVVVEARLDIVDLVARMAGGHEMLVPVLDPPDRPFHRAREERNEQFLGIDVAFDAKTAADVERDAADARLGHVQHGGRLAPQPVHDLAGRPDRHRIGAFVVERRRRRGTPSGWPRSDDGGSAA